MHLANSIKELAGISIIRGTNISKRTTATLNGLVVLFATKFLTFYYPTLTIEIPFVDSSANEEFPRPDNVCEFRNFLHHSLAGWLWNCSSIARWKRVGRAGKSRTINPLPMIH